MRALGIIPARWGSTRFPGKPLAKIAGKELLAHVIEGARTSRTLSEICVATDDERIAGLARRCGVRVAMTASNLPTGTDRVWAAAEQLGKEFDVVVNIQGDEPLIEGRILDRLLEPFTEDKGIEMATLGRTLDEESLRSMQTAKIVLNLNGEALYFSRLPIPFSRAELGTQGVALKHIGIYAYRRDFLRRFCAQGPTVLEQCESLEQLRALAMGARIRVVEVEDDSWGVDTPEDVQKIETILSERRSLGVR